MIALLVATVLRFATPAFDATAPESCAAGPVPCRDLALVRLYGQPQWGGDTLLAEHRAAAAGAPDSFDVVLDARPWSLWAVAVDSAGNESCRGTPLRLNGAAAVDPVPLGLWLGVPRPNPASGLVAVPFCLPEAGTASVEVIDIAGRRRATLTWGSAFAGIHVVIWQTTGCETGVYLLWLRSGSAAIARRVVLLK